MKPEIIDARDPEWQRRAFEMVDLNGKLKFVNLRPEEHEEFIYKLRAYARSKMQTPERFEGTFDCDGIEF